MNSKITIFILDDHQMLIDGLSALLKNEKEFHIVGTSNFPEKALDEILKLKPNILLTDVNMPIMSGVEVIKQLKPLLPDTKFIALSMAGDRQTITDMIHAGALGFILKNTGKQELILALQKVATGKNHYSDDIAQTLAQSILQPAQNNLLTTRELEIVKLIDKEYTNAQIADQLFISERTVETHRKNIFRKSETKSVLGLINWARANSLL
ncbi:MAG: response regulator transcription factor [Bacteroidetes bacterium]|nr:response regulator transcription factor [Bacteroidota bacterium]